jgi:carbon storage regulator CsrA
MLVLTRRPGDSLMIGDDVEVYLARIDRGTVRLAIRAPRELRIRRGELAPAKSGNRRTKDASRQPPGNRKRAGERPAARKTTAGRDGPARRRRRRVIIEPA